jgi:hypothetical protein
MPKIHSGAMGENDDAGPDGKSYVDAAVAAGQRSRTIISIVLVLMVLTFTSLRNNYEPNWNYTRIQLYEELYDCLKANDFGHARCAPLRERIGQIEGRLAVADDMTKLAANAEVELRGQYSSEDFPSLNETKIDEVKKRYETLISKESNAVVAIPVLGSQIDFNDLWMVSGVIMFFLLYMLYASIEQEYRSVKFIAEHKKSYLDLVIMNQVMPLLRVHGNRVLYVVQTIILLSPTWLYLYVFWSDWDTYEVSLAFVGRLRTIIEYFVEGTIVVAVIYVNIRCVRAQAKLQQVLHAGGRGSW